MYIRHNVRTRYCIIDPQLAAGESGLFGEKQKFYDEDNKPKAVGGAPIYFFANFRTAYNFSVVVVDSVECPHLKNFSLEHPNKGHSQHSPNDTPDKT